MKPHHPIYRHRQWATLILAMLGISMVIIGVFFVPHAGASAFARPALASVVGVVALLAVLFHSLVVTVDRDTGEPFVRVQFGLGPIRRTIPIARIVGARAVRNAWWYGWGIRLTPHGWLWNVSGLDAVELELTSGKRFRIGTNDPKRLVRAIEEARATQS